MHKIIKNSFYILVSIFLTLGLSFSLQSLFAAWSGPSTTPPNNNAYGAVNVGSTGQNKAGGLLLNTSGGANGLIVYSGNVGINTTTPVDKLSIFGGGISLSELSSSPSNPPAGTAKIYLKKGSLAGDDYTKVLLHFDGTGSSITDAANSSRSIAVYGNSTQTSAQSKFGGESLYLDGSGDYLVMSDSDVNLGTGDFTIDYWVKADADLGSSYFLENNNSPRNFIQMSKNSVWASFRYSSGLELQSSSVDLTSWSHIAVVRSGTSVKLYVNGNSVASVTSSADFGYAPIKYFGAYTGGIYNFKGYIDEFRISVGTARWTSNFTPPTSAYGGSLLSDLYIKDSAGNEFKLSAVNNTTIVSNPVVSYHKSCKEIKDAGESTGSGVYTIDPDGDGGYGTYQVYCDMTNDGGGWTLVFKLDSSTSYGPLANNVSALTSVSAGKGKLSDDIIQSLTTTRWAIQGYNNSLSYASNYRRYFDTSCKFSADSSTKNPGECHTSCGNYDMNSDCATGDGAYSYGVRSYCCYSSYSWYRALMGASGNGINIPSVGEIGAGSNGGVILVWVK